MHENHLEKIGESPGPGVSALAFSSKIHGHPPAGRRRHPALMQRGLVELQPARIARSNDSKLKLI